MFIVGTVMTSPMPMSITSPQTCILKWFLKDVQKQPTLKSSPIFEVEIGKSKEQIQLNLSNNNDLIQIQLQPIGSLTPHQLVAVISDVSLTFRFSGNQTKQFDKIRVRATAAGDAVLFDVTRLSFQLVTNGYKDPIEIDVQLNLQPAELVKMVWTMTDVKALPLFKESPVFSFNVDGVPHKLRLSMDINNDCIQMRMSQINTNIRKFAASIKKMCIVYKSADNKPPIKIDDVEVRKVCLDLIYLTTSRLSFAKLTANHQNPLEVTLQIQFGKTMASSSEASVSPRPPTSGLKPKTFDWRLDDCEMFPLTKTSPLFRMDMSDNTLIPVQLLLKHHRDEPIKLFLAATMKSKELVSTIAGATIKITDGNGAERTFENVLPQCSDELIFFDTADNNLKFFDLTNGFKSAIRILCVFHRSCSNNKSTTPIEVPPTDTPLSLFAPNPLPTTLLRQLNTLLVGQIDCDVQFDCQGILIGAHRPILKSRSAFFKELLLEHKDQTLFPFKRIDAETMADTLQFIYTGNAPRIATTAERLLSVANLMELPELHGLAQQQLLQKGNGPVSSTTSSLESIVKLLDLFEVKKLQPQVGSFIRTHLDDLLGNPHFERELKRRSSVCFDLLVWLHASNKSQI